MSQECKDCKHYQRMYDRIDDKFYRICWLPSLMKIGQGQFVKADSHCDMWEARSEKNVQ